MAWWGFERRWRDTVMAAIVPAGDGELLPAFGDAVDERFWDRLGRVAPPLLRLGLRLGVWFLTLGPLFLVGRFRTFGGLTPEARDRVLERAHAHRFYLIRQLALALKLVACFAYFESDGVRDRVDGLRGQATVQKLRAELADGGTV